MTTTTTPAGPTAAPRPPRRPKRRWLAAIVVVLLIAIPAGYMVYSAQDSRASGEGKAKAASARSLVYEWPTRLERRIYDVPVPDGSTYVGHYETNSWDRSTMYVQFRTSSEDLSAFLEEVGTTRSELEEGRVTISRADADVIGWDFDDPTRRFAGTVVEQASSEPEVAITVDLTRDDRPRVYIVSTTEP